MSLETVTNAGLTTTSLENQNVAEPRPRLAVERPVGESPPEVVTQAPPATAEILEQIRLALTGLKYGHVTIVVQDGQVMQIDRVQQQRLFRAPKRR